MVRFNLLYKNRQGTQNAVDNGEPKIFGVGNHWHTTWRSYVEAIPGNTTNFWVYLGDGTATLFSSNIVDYVSRARLTQSTTTNIIEFSDGSKNYYGFQTNLGGVTRYFITRKEDPQGNGLSFSYLVTNNSIRLDTVTDPDNRTITFQYTSTGIYSNLLTKLIGPHGLTNTLQYDSSGNLTNITDVIGLTSRMQYDGTNLTALITPYGTNTYTYFSASNQMYAIHVNEQNTRYNFFLYRDEVEGGKVPNSYSSYQPGTTNAGYFSLANSFDGSNSHQRNSFHWNPRQYEHLSDSIRTNLANGIFSVSNLTTADYSIARQKHWLKAAGGTNTGCTISLQRDASPDGTLQGQVHWYDYTAKSGGNVDREGTSIRPTFTAWKLPNGECRLKYFDRNELGHMTNKVETYTESDGTCRLRTNQYFYAANNIDLIRKVQILGSTSRQVGSNLFNAYHQVVTNYDALGQITSYAYNGNRQLTTMKAAGGLTRTHNYNSAGTWSNFVSSTILNEIGRTNNYSFSNGYVFSKTDARGLALTFSADLAGRLLSKSYPDGTRETHLYDRLDPVKHIDRLNCTNQYVYNGLRQRTQEIDPRSSTSTYSYCSCGALDSVTDPVGKTTQLTYDLQSRRCTVTFAGSGTITNNYNLIGQLTNVIDSAGASVTNAYNNQGRICRTDAAAGCLNLTTFDIEDHPINVIDSNSVTNSYTFDQLGRVVQRTDGNGITDTLGYSALGVIVRTNQLGATNWWAYDAAGRRTAATNANGEITLYTYNSAGDLIKLRDAKGNETSWGYDQYGRVTSKTNANGTEILRYAYDANGRLTNRWTLAKGNTAYGYDSAGNLTNIHYPNSPDVSMQYDANNRVTNMVDAAGTSSFTYTDFGALLSEDGPWESDKVTYSYTTNQLRGSFALQQPSSGSWQQTYSYDTANRLTTIISPAGTFTYTYDPTAHQQISKIALPNSSSVTNAYDALGRMTGTYLKNSGGSPINSHEYSYDAANRVTRQIQSEGNYVDYTYDAVGQLKSATGKESGGGTNRWNEQFGYSYDGVGNLLNRTNGTLIQTFSVNPLNQLTNVSRNGKYSVAGTTWGSATNVTVADNGNAAGMAIRYSDATFVRTNISLLDGTNTFTAAAQDSYGRSDNNTVTSYLPASNQIAYDGNGNMTTNGSRVFDYDDEDQLIRITEPNAWKSEFTYDGRMRRRIRKEFTLSGSAWVQTNEVHYVYDGKLVVQERDALNQVVATYTRGLDLSGTTHGAGGIGGLLARIDGRTLCAAFYHADRLGNVTLLLDSNEKLLAKYRYEPFGNLIMESGSLSEVNNYRFSSMETHPNSGLVAYRYRLYDANLQRWTAADPIGEADGPNRFWFVRNSPCQYVDPDGTSPLAAAIIPAAVLVLGVAAIVCYCDWSNRHPPTCPTGTTATAASYVGFGVTIPCGYQCTTSGGGGGKK